jgi:hypothetical protein
VTKQETFAAAFTGQWIGEKQGCTMPAHLWEISQHGNYLWLRTRWEDESPSSSGHFSAQMVPGEFAFKILGEREYKATLLDRQHFIIPDWCSGSTGPVEEDGPSYDVIFSRPGIAELTARAVYLKSLETNALAEDADQSTNLATSPKGK